MSQIINKCKNINHNYILCSQRVSKITRQKITMFYVFLPSCRSWSGQTEPWYLSNVECLIFSEHSRLQREALQQENTGWLGSSGYDSSQPGYGLRRTNKDYSVPGIFSSLNLANISQLVLTMLESLQDEWLAVWERSELRYWWVWSPLAWPALVPPGHWFIIVQWWR